MAVPARNRKARGIQKQPPALKFSGTFVIIFSGTVRAQVMETWAWSAATSIDVIFFYYMTMTSCKTPSSWQFQISLFSSRRMTRLACSCCARACWRSHFSGCWFHRKTCWGWGISGVATCWDFRSSGSELKRKMDRKADPRCCVFMRLYVSLGKSDPGSALPSVCTIQWQILDHWRNNKSFEGCMVNAEQCPSFVWKKNVRRSILVLNLPIIPLLYQFYRPNWL